jgi:hypothetical protein
VALACNQVGTGKVVHSSKKIVSILMFVARFIVLVGKKVVDGPFAGG